MKSPLILCSLIFSLFLSAHTQAKTFVYVSESGDRRIAVFEMDEGTGELTRIGQTDLEGSPGCLHLSEDRTRIHASVRSASAFASLAVNSETGLLEVIGTAPSAGSASYVFLDRTEKWLLAAYYREGLVSVSKVENGAVSGEPLSVLEVGPKAHCIQTDPSNQFAFCPHPVDLNRVTQLKFDSNTGQIELNQPPGMVAGDGHGPRHLQFHPNGKWVYVVNEQGKSVTLCDYDAETGTLKMRQTLSTHPEDWDLSLGSCADIEISADGKFVYASNRGHDSIAQFSIDSASGELASLGQVSTAKTPRSFNLIPGGENYLVAAGQGANQLIVYRRDANTGRLSAIHTYDCGKSPAWVLGVKFEE